MNSKPKRSTIAGTGNRALFFILPLLLTLSCTSRYRLDFYMVSGEQSKKVKIEQTEYVQGATISDPAADEKLTPGIGNCIILNIGTRGEQLQVSLSTLIGYDEYFRCLVYLQLPPEPKPDTINLIDESFVHVLGQYEIPHDQKIFLPDSGVLVVDSLAGKHLFATMTGYYRNQLDTTIAFNGRFKVKIAR